MQLLEGIAAYSHGKSFDSADNESDSGAVLHLEVNEQGLYHFTMPATSFAITPGELTRTTGAYRFDPVDMKPPINCPGHAKVLEYLKDLAQYGPTARVSWSLGKAWDYFLPLAASAATATAMITFAFTWNEFLFSSSLGITQTKMMPAHMTGAIDTCGVQVRFMATCALIVMAPPVLLALIVQRYVVCGLTLGVVKG